MNTPLNLTPRREGAKVPRRKVDGVLSHLLCKLQVVYQPDTLCPTLTLTLVAKTTSVDNPDFSCFLSHSLRCELLIFPTSEGKIRSAARLTPFLKRSSGYRSVAMHTRRG